MSTELPENKDRRNEGFVVRADILLSVMREALDENDTGLACACAAEMANLVGDSYLYKVPFREIHDKVRNDLRDMVPNETTDKVFCALAA
jgi:hypothetical protein